MTVRTSHVAVHVLVCVPRRQVSGIGGAVLPFVQGLVSDGAGLRLSMLTASVSGALGVVVMLVFRCMTRRTLLAPPTGLANAPAPGEAEMSL
jgi:fucose permease